MEVIKHESCLSFFDIDFYLHSLMRACSLEAHQWSTAIQTVMRMNKKTLNAYNAAKSVRADLVFDGAVVEFCKRDERGGRGLDAQHLSLSVALQLSGATGQRAVLL